MYLLDVDEMFVCVNSLPVACWTSHVASPVGAFDFSFAKLVQAAFCKYWSLAPDFHGKFQQPSAFSFPKGKGQGQNKMWYSKIFLEIPCIYMPSPCLLLDARKNYKSSTELQIKRSQTIKK